LIATTDHIRVSEDVTLCVQHSLHTDRPPLLLLHGYPQSHRIWHRVAPLLADRYSLVMPDLRGYGASSAPPGEPDHANYSKRRMAQDMLALMATLGYEEFSLVGHDRGGRVGHRLALDAPSAVRRLMVLDIAPTLAMYEQTSMDFATRYWWWFFLIQPAPLPEALISAAPEIYLATKIGSGSAGLRPFAPENYAAYLTALRDPARVHAMCEDYRAAASIDLLHDRADRDAGRTIQCPVRALWGATGVIERCFDPLSEWRKVTRPDQPVSGLALAGGHYLPEELPSRMAEEIAAFMQA
jgi:haloacetate dehalogenase